MMLKTLKIVTLAIALGAVASPAALAKSQAAEAVVESTEARTDIDVALNTFLSENSNILILLPHKLDRSKLDFSMDSLAAVDDWLQAVHTLNKLEAGEGKAGESMQRDGRGDNTVVFAGLYLGEVVRLNSEQTWVWQPFEAFVANNPAHATVLGDDAGLDAYVLVSEQGVATPINSALKRVLNGSIDSVHYIGSFLSTPVDLDKALSGHDFSSMPAPVAVD